MADTLFGIDKGVVKAFGLMIIIVGSLTTFFLSEYVSAILLGAVFYTSNNGSTYADTAITAESFTAINSTPQELAHSLIYPTTLRVTNSSGSEFGIGNFTVTYNNGTILLNSGVQIANGTSMLANYTYLTVTTSKLPISSDAESFVDTAEDDFVTTFTYLNTGVKFAAALITVVAVILIFSSFLPKKGKKDNLDY